MVILILLMIIDHFKFEINLDIKIYFHFYFRILKKFMKLSKSFMHHLKVETYYIYL